VHTTALSSRQPHTKLNAGSAYVSTRTGKEERLEQYKGWLEGAEMIFAIPAQGMTVKQVAQLRKAVPQDTKVGRWVGRNRGRERRRGLRALGSGVEW